MSFYGLILALSISGYVFFAVSPNPVSGEEGFRVKNSKNETWNYVNVRDGAYMFWWLYQADDSAGNKPLIIWLQGGPGGSSTGYGNFNEIGPLDVHLKPRKTTWLSAAHLLFIDNPVGTGFSYVTSDQAYAKNNDMIAADLLTTFSSFLKEQSSFQNIPVYVFSESYGGKMTAGFGRALNEAVKSGKLKCNFQGVALGDSWISSMDYVLTWGPYLYATSLIDEQGLTKINASAQETLQAFNSGQYDNATYLWSLTETVVLQVTGGVNFYNILDWNSQHLKTGSTSNKYLQIYHNDELSDLMNGPIRKKLGIIPKNVTWGGQSGNVFHFLKEDFMKPVIDDVDDLLTNSSLKVIVYNGQLDLICDTLGTERWVQKLSWPGLSGYNKATRKQLKGHNTADPWGFVKSFKNLQFFWILEAGHMVPSDAGEAALEMLNIIFTS